MVISILVIAVLLPNAAAFVGVEGLLNQAGGIRSDAEKSEFLSQHIIDMTAYGWLPRAENDYYQFLISGAGSCGEMAMASANLMKAAGLDVRKVVFPGEDHAFVEVRINGTWMIPNGAALLTRENMTENRIAGVGSLTYVAAPTEDSFIELTQEYISTDTITTQIVKDNAPMVNANLVLKHTFNHQEQQLPFAGGSFHTDNTGTVTLHLGKPHYIKEYTGSEEYYWIWVNGQNINHTITSARTGAFQSVKIGLSG